MASKIDDILEYFDRTSDQFFSKDEFRAKLKSNKKLRIKYGVDVTAPTLHIGHAVNMWLMRYLQDRGHKIVFLIGDFTTRIGDPTDRSEARPVISREDIEKNALAFIEQAKMVLRFDDPKLIEIRRNSEWYEKMPLQDMLNLLSVVTHARLISRDMFQMRIAEGKEIHMHEMLYPVLQGYDSVMVQSDITIIGSDQLFNEMMGRTFQEKKGQKPQTIITTKITPGTDGRAKQSKSMGNYIGLAHTPRDKFGRVMSIPDDLIDSYFRVYTDVPLSEIDKMAEMVEFNPREAKMKLAYAIVGRYHGHEVAVEEREWFVNTISKGKVPEDIPVLTVLNPRLQLIELVKLARPTKSKGDSRRLITQGGVELNSEKLTQPDGEVMVKEGDILKVGKRNWFRIQVSKLHELETERLMLKPMQIEDIDLLQKYIPSWEMTKYMGKMPSSKKAAEEVTKEVFKKVIAKPEPKDEWLWKISKKIEPKNLVGVAHLRSDPKGGNENIWLDPDMLEQGYMAEAMDAINEYAFYNLGFSTLHFKNAFSHAAAPQELETLRARFMAMDSSMRNHDDPSGAWGFTKEGWDYMKEQIRRNSSSDISTFSDAKGASSRFARQQARVEQQKREHAEQERLRLEMLKKAQVPQPVQTPAPTPPKQEPLPFYLQPPSPKPTGK